VSDVVELINHVFGDEELIVEPCICDASGDGVINVTDIVHMVYYIFAFAPPVSDCCD
jgi:hypothetical protein